MERDGQGGWTPLHLAVAGERAEVMRLLVAAGADLIARTEHGRDPLHTALESAPGLVPLLRELLDAGADVDATADGASALDITGVPWRAPAGTTQVRRRRRTPLPPLFARSRRRSCSRTGDGAVSHPVRLQLRA